MKKQQFWEVVVLGSLLIILAGISPVVGESNKSGGDEQPVMEAIETASFGTEDFIVVSETASFGTEDFIVASSITPSFGTEDYIVASETASFGTEDWVLATEAVSFGAEDWAEGMEYSDAVATGTLPAPAR
ncbi:MAG: hypothetical protein ACWGPR_09905 [Candidatus Deferrimicrobiaceae bacterium]